MSKNYADALRKPAPVPQVRRPDPKDQEAGAKRPRQQNAASQPSPSTPSTAPVPVRASAWGRPVATVTAKKPTAIMKRPKEESASNLSLVKPPPTKKSKKPRPTQMSLGDVMPKEIVSKKNRPAVIPVNPPSVQQQVAVPMELSSQEDFPSLSAGTAIPSKPKPSLPAHAGWGKKSPPKKEKTQKKVAPKSTPKQQMKQSSGEKHMEVKKERPSLLDFGAKPRTHEGREEHDLIRLMQEGKAQGVMKKGRQRITPRKKRFTTLKKKVLQERLEAWRKLPPELDPTTTTRDATTAPNTTNVPVADTTTCTVYLQNFADAEEVEDDDEYEEIVANVKEMAVKVGPIRDAFLHRQSSGYCPAFIWFENPQSAAAAYACWNGLVVGGQRLDPSFLYPRFEQSDNSANTEAWRKAALSAQSSKRDDEKQDSVSNVFRSVILRNVLSEEDFDDKEHLEESLSYIRNLVDKHGTVVGFEIIQDAIIAVTYGGDDSITKEAVTKLDGLFVGGKAISASLSDETAVCGSEHVVELKNALTEDDLEDEDCLKESLNDIEMLAKKYGALSDGDSIKVDGLRVLITVKGTLAVAEAAAANLDGTLLGGNALQACVLSSPDASQPSSGRSGWVLLQNILTEDDIVDEECMEESIEDVKELASRYGKVLNVMFDSGDLTRVVRIEYEGGSEVAAFAAEKFNNMVLGGQTIAAMALSSEKEAHGSVTVETKTAITENAESKNAASKPMYSGDKLIPERFAACKRVPKVVTSTGPREYACLSTNEDVTPLLIEMLGELMRLQRRAIEDKNAKARRRIVMGLREVARGIRAHKVKMVIMANNLDEYGAIDEKLQEILDLARQEDVPVMFQLNKRKLGKAVGKNIKVSVVGVQSSDGAHQQFKKLAALAGKT